MKNKIWFKAKMFGLGWRPVTWQGWILTLLYVIDIIWYARVTDAGSHSVSDFLLNFGLNFVIITILFLIICWTKGERLSSRWHKRKK